MILDYGLLKLYANNGFNVLLSGRPGVGKTELIKKVFTECFGDDKWAYFSAATMDAWVDFVGVPKVVMRGDKEVLELIRPARFADDAVEAIFFDEFNRAPAKVRNAVMELIQFKSINGRKFNNLKVIWAAVNPFDEEGTYDVEKLDPAQLDRFQIQLDVPYKLDRAYLKSKYGFIATPFAEWWEKLSKELQYSVSPRRLEDALRVHLAKGNLDHVLKKETNVNDLRTRIRNVSLDDEWVDLLTKTHDEKLEFFHNISNVSKFEEYILKEFTKFVGYVPHDYLVSQFETKQVTWIDLALNNEAAIPVEVVTVMEKGSGKSFIDTLKAFKGVLPINMKFDLNGKNVVVTGAFVKTYKDGNLTRPEVDTLMTRIGAKLQKKVTGTTDYLITADPNTNTTKYQDAVQFNVPILSEDDFHAVYGTY